MAFIAPKHEGAKRPRVEGNKCHAFQAHDITSLYPEVPAHLEMQCI